MKIHHLEVRNFRAFEYRSFSFSDQFTLLIGDNCTGKTAVLNALSAAASPLIQDLEEVPFDKDNVRCVRYTKGEVETIEPQYPVELHCEGEVNGQPISWMWSLSHEEGVQLSLFGEGESQKLSWFNFVVSPEIKRVSWDLQDRVRSGQDVLLPLIAYYGTDRLWLERKRTSVKRSKKTIEPGSRMLGYKNCLQPGADPKPLLSWFKTMEIASLQRNEPIGVLEAAKVAISNCMEDWCTVTYDLLIDDLLATSIDGHTLPFRMLSDGVRNMLAMVADIAYRAAVLNPHLQQEAAEKTPGIVLIDEIDLHLHPKWQRRIVEDLRRTFPEIQFIATTHSPFIVQSLRPGELINLDPQFGEYYKKSIEDITEDVMGVDLPQQSERWKKMMEAAEEYYRVLQEAQGASSEHVEKLKQRLDELTLPYRDDPAYQAFLNMEREAAGLGEEKEAE